MIRLTKQQVILLHRDVIAQSGGSPEIRDEGLLESALNAPIQTFAAKPTIKMKYSNRLSVFSIHSMLSQQMY